MPTEITKEQIAKIAQLARLEVSDSEAEALVGDLAEIVNYVAKLSDISTVGVSATTHINNSHNIFREDIKRDSLKTEELEKMAPDFSGSGFRVPKVI